MGESSSYNSVLQRIFIKWLKCIYILFRVSILWQLGVTVVVLLVSVCDCPMTLLCRRTFVQGEHGVHYLTLENLVRSMKLDISVHDPYRTQGPVEPLSLCSTEDSRPLKLGCENSHANGQHTRIPLPPDRVSEDLVDLTNPACPRGKPTETPSFTPPPAALRVSTPAPFQNVIDNGDLIFRACWKKSGKSNRQGRKPMRSGRQGPRNCQQNEFNKALRREVDKKLAEMAKQNGGRFPIRDSVLIATLVGYVNRNGCQRFGKTDEQVQTAVIR